MRNFITLPTFPAFKTHHTAIQYKLAVRSQIKIKMWPTNGPTVKSGWKAKKHKTKKGNSKLKSCSVQPTRQAKPSGALIVLLFSSGELNLILSSPSRKAGPDWVLVSIWCHPSRQAELGWLQTSQDVIWQVVTLPPHQTRHRISIRSWSYKKLMCCPESASQFPSLVKHHLCSRLYNSLLQLLGFQSLGRLNRTFVDN